MNFVPTYSADVVGVFDASFNQLFANSESMKANVGRSKKPMEHPIESGATITDHVVILPVEVELLIILNPEQYQNTYRQIEDAFNSSALLTVQTKVRGHDNMIIVGMPHDEAPDIFDTVAVSLKLQEVKLIRSQFQALPPQSTNKKTDSSTVNRGEKSGTPDNGTGRGGGGSVLYDIVF